MVLLHDNAPRATWKMGILEELITGDGIVRAVTLRTATGLTNRLVTRLYPLEFNVTTQTETEATQRVDIVTTESLTGNEPLVSARPQQCQPIELLRR